MAATISGIMGHSNLVQATTWDDLKKVPFFQLLDDTLRRFYKDQSEIKFERKQHMNNIDDFIKHFTFNSKASFKLQSPIVAAFKDNLVTRIEKDLASDSPQRAHWMSRRTKQSAAPWKASDRLPPSCCSMLQVPPLLASPDTATQPSCNVIICCSTA